ncbi:Hypothetical_protein [Hexamita inflata]|uniref:Hypothetical_protein n=1 Tax=Hexamita inflata TaxID=28002 RepID=A0AA86UQ08_9EUKA|nr:Hypothetical protein HINF_LOCUS51299 [Hexamita inflata]
MKKLYVELVTIMIIFLIKLCFHKILHYLACKGGAILQNQKGVGQLAYKGAPSCKTPLQANRLLPYKQGYVVLHILLRKVVFSLIRNSTCTFWMHFTYKGCKWFMQSPYQ